MTPLWNFSEKSSILVLQSLPKGSLKLRRVRGCLHAWEDFVYKYSLNCQYKGTFKILMFA